MGGDPRPAALPAYVTPRPGGCTLLVRVVPRAGRTVIAGVREGALLVRLAAPPVDGAANDALVAFLAGQLDAPRHTIQLISGERTRDKRLEVDVAPAVAAARLAPLPTS